MGRPRTFDEAAVVGAAREQFRCGGYSGTSLDDLTSATNLGRGSLYGAFGSKHELFLQALGGYCADATKALAELLDGPEETALARLREHAEAFAGKAPRDVDPNGCLLGNTTMELAGQDAAVAERTLATYRAQEAIYARCVAQAQAHGDVDPAADPEALARLYLATLRGIGMLGKAGMDADELRATVDTVMGLLPAPRPVA